MRIEGTREQAAVEVPAAIITSTPGPTLVNQSAKVRSVDAVEPKKTPDDDKVNEHIRTWSEGEHLEFPRTRFMPGVTVEQATRVLANLKHFSDDQFHKVVAGPAYLPAARGVEFNMDHTNWPLIWVHDSATVRGVVTRWEPGAEKTFQTLLELQVKGAPTPDHEQAVSVKAVAGGVDVTWRVTTKHLAINYPSVVRKALRVWVGWQMAMAIEKKVNLMEHRIENRETHAPLRSKLARWFQDTVKPMFSFQWAKTLPQAPGELQ